jgi:hypothetical protein
MPFDPELDIVGLRGDYFGTGVTDHPSEFEMSALRPEQQNMLMRSYMTDIAPMKREMMDMESRALQNQSRVMQIESQKMAFQTQKRNDQETRDMLTRIPTLMNDLGEARSLAESDPAAAGEALLRVTTEFGKDYAKNPTARALIDSVSSIIDRSVARRDAKNERLYGESQRLLASDDETLRNMGIASARKLGEEGDALIESISAARASGIAKESDARLAAEQFATATEQKEQRLKDLDRYEEMAYKMDFEDPVQNFETGELMQGALTQETAFKLRGMAEMLDIQDRSDDPLVLQKQILSSIKVQKQQELGGRRGGKVFGGMVPTAPTAKTTK